MSESELEPERASAALRRHLAQLDALVPERAPAWRPAALGAVALVGVAATMVPAALATMLVERLLVADRDAADVVHGMALGAFVVLWGTFALLILRLAARISIGRGAAIAGRDLMAAGVVLLLVGLWVVALHAWNVGVAGYVEIDLIGRGTYIWPAVVVSLVVALAAARLADRRVAIVLGLIAGLGIAALLFEMIINVLGASADGDVSAAGLVVGVLSALQLFALVGWWLDVVRPRLRRWRVRQ